MGERKKVIGKKAKSALFWRAICIFLLCGLIVPTGLSPASCQDVQELIRTVDERQQKIQTVSANFSQKREVSLAQKPLFSSGLVKFKRPDRIRWTYLAPELMEVLLDGKSIFSYIPGRSQAEKYSLSTGKRMAQYLEPLTAVFQKTLAQLAERYAVLYRGIEGDHTYLFRLQPKEEKIQKFLSRIDLWVDKDSGAILRFKMVESSGDQLTLEFKNLQINLPLSDDDLILKIPPSVKVLEQILP